MKKSFPLLLGALLLNVALIAQNYYTVQVGTFLDAKRSDFSAIEDAGFIHAVRLEGNLYQVYAGGFDKRSDADQALAIIKKKGYTNAFVQERQPAEGNTVTVIQLGLKNTTKGIDWDPYLRAGTLYTIINGDKLKLVTGLYAGVNEAKGDLSDIRKQGFSDAFIKNVNTIFLHKISAFETGGAKQELIPLGLNNRTAANQPAPASYSEYGGRINTGSDLQAKSPVARPNSYDYGSTMSPRAVTPATSASAPAVAVSYPAIRPRVKRRSVLELQKALKADGFYSSSLDGLYGNGTANAYNNFKNNNREYKKYILLSKYNTVPGQDGEEAQLQNAVNNLLTDATAQRYVEMSASPVAKAYQAYLRFQTYGPGPEVNILMNAAIQGAYVGKTLDGQPPFDYRATYAYDNLQQLILHIHYVHSGPEIDIAVPCWLFQRHPAETGYAYETYARFSGGTGFPVQSCDQFLQWEEVGALQAIAIDLDANPQLDKQRLAAAASHRVMLYLAPEKLSTGEKQTLDAWSSRLMNGLSQWGNQDPLHKKLVDAFTVAFFQSEVLLEDFYMDKGFNAEEAKGLAQATLHTIVAYHLERFVTG